MRYERSIKGFIPMNTALAVIRDHDSLIDLRKNREAVIKVYPKPEAVRAKYGQKPVFISLKVLF